MFKTTGISAAALLVLGASPAFAQEDRQQLEKVVVTGSMIPRTSAETSEAITILTAESLRSMGITTVEQAVRQIASNQSRTLTSSTVSSWGTGGASFANLRGLGAARTLVLLDGQRLVGNAQTGGPVDMNSIPFAAVDRIEVLRERASSVYGADAVAGVINFITKKGFQGGQANLIGVSPQQSGGGSYGGDIAYGVGNLASDGYNLTGTLSYTKQKALRALQRGFAQRGGGDNAYYTSPGSYVDSAGKLFSVDYPDCGKSTGANTAYLSTRNGYCGYQYTDATDLLPASSVASGMLQLTKALDADNALTLQYFATQSKVRSWGGAYSYYVNMNPAFNVAYFPTAGRSSPNTAFFDTPANATPDLNMFICRSFSVVMVCGGSPPHLYRRHRTTNPDIASFEPGRARHFPVLEADAWRPT